MVSPEALSLCFYYLYYCAHREIKVLLLAAIDNLKKTEHFQAPASEGEEGAAAEAASAPATTAAAAAPPSLSKSSSTSSVRAAKGDSVKSAAAPSAASAPSVAAAAAAASVAAAAGAAASSASPPLSPFAFVATATKLPRPIPRLRFALPGLPLSPFERAVEEGPAPPVVAAAGPSPPSGEKAAALAEAEVAEFASSSLPAMPGWSLEHPQR